MNFFLCGQTHSRESARFFLCHMNENQHWMTIYCGPIYGDLLKLKTLLSKHILCNPPESLTIWLNKIFLIHFKMFLHLACRY